MRKPAMKLKDLKIAVIGLGYVGLPLALELSKKRHIIGLDINEQRIQDLKAGVDKTREVSREKLEEAKELDFTSDFSDLKDMNCYIITVPTPIDKQKRPVLTPLLQASKNVSY